MSKYEVVTIILATVTVVLTIWIFLIDKKINDNNFWYRTIFIQDNGLINKIFEFKKNIESILKPYTKNDLDDETKSKIIRELIGKFRIFDENFIIVEVMNYEISELLSEESSNFRDEITKYVDQNSSISEYEYIKITTEFTKIMLASIYKFSKASTKKTCSHAL